MNAEGSEILSYFQANKLDCHLMDAERRQDSWSEMKDGLQREITVARASAFLHCYLSHNPHMTL